MEEVYKKLEVVGSSKTGIEEAIKNALAEAARTIRHLRWFEVTEVRGFIENGKVSYYQVGLKIGFVVEETK